MPPHTRYTLPGFLPFMVARGKAEGTAAIYLRVVRAAINAIGGHEAARDPAAINQYLAEIAPTTRVVLRSAWAHYTEWARAGYASRDGAPDSIPAPTGRDPVAPFPDPPPIQGVGSTPNRPPEKIENSIDFSTEPAPPPGDELTPADLPADVDGLRPLPSEVIAAIRTLILVIPLPVIAEITWAAVSSTGILPPGAKVAVPITPGLAAAVRVLHTWGCPQAITAPLIPIAPTADVARPIRRLRRDLRADPTGGHTAGTPSAIPLPALPRAPDLPREPVAPPEDLPYAEVCRRQAARLADIQAKSAANTAELQRAQVEEWQRTNTQRQRAHLRPLTWTEFMNGIARPAEDLPAMHELTALTARAIIESGSAAGVALEQKIRDGGPDHPLRGALLSAEDLVGDTD